MFIEPLLSNALSKSITLRFQSKAVRMITNAFWFVPNAVTLRDLQMPATEEKIRRFSLTICRSPK
jgi:hypothetical protein